MNHLMECHYCKKMFRAFRKDARFCSNSCRVSYHQLPGKFSEKAGNASGYMIDIYTLFQRFPEKRQDAEKQLAWLQDRLNDIKAKMEKED